MAKKVKKMISVDPDFWRKFKLFCGGKGISMSSYIAQSVKKSMMDDRFKFKDPSEMTKDELEQAYSEYDKRAVRTPEEDEYFKRVTDEYIARY